MTTTKTKAPTSLQKGQLFVALAGLKDSWGSAMELVDFPVMIKPLQFEHDGSMVFAKGETPTGRENEFHGIVVDRNKTGELKTIATVTEMYGTMPPAQVYEMLMNDLNSIDVKAFPHMLYVSGNGGRQSLLVNIEGQKAPNLKDDISMMIKIHTSLDGSKRHVVELVAYNKTDDSEFVGIGTEQFGLSSRHTKTLSDRHVAFSVTMNKMVESWNETIMPMFALMNDAKFDRSTAVDLLTSIVEDAKLAKSHIKSVEAHYLTKMMDEGGEHSIYTVMSGLSKYLQSHGDDHPDHAEKIRLNVEKAAQKRIQAALEKLR